MARSYVLNPGDFHPDCVRQVLTFLIIRKLSLADNKQMEKLLMTINELGLRKTNIHMRFVSPTSPLPSPPWARSGV